jgi:hypothetical protein
MYKTNGLVLDNDEVLLLQKIMGNLLGTEEPNEVARKVVELKDGNEPLFRNKAGIGLFIVDFMRHNKQK